MYEQVWGTVKMYTGVYISGLGTVSYFSNRLTATVNRLMKILTS